MTATAKQAQWAHGGAEKEVRPAQPTEFERIAAKLGLSTQAQMLASQSLKRWAERNKNHRFVPEELLKKWGITVEVLEGQFHRQRRPYVPCYYGAP